MDGCATNPVTGKKQVALISEAQEIAMGREYDPQIVAEFGLYPDSAIQRFINARGMEMARISHRPNLQWTFRVLDSDVINAFAVPGGYVYFTRGILANMNNEAQFAGVLGHEIGHVTARHSVSQQTKGLLTQLGVIAAVIANKNVAQFAEQLSQGAQLLMLSFSREAETQSDELGVAYSTQVGYDAREMAKFFLTLKREQDQSSHARLPEFLSTHPDPGNRYERVTQLATQVQQQNNLTNLKINREGYLRTIEGIVYGEDPRHGYIEGGYFYHPEMKFQFRHPLNWQYKNSPTSVVFSPQQGDAVCMLTLGQGNSPQAAAEQFVQTNKIQVTESQQSTINGLPAFIIAGQQLQQDQSGRQVPAVRLLTAFIQYNNAIYIMAAASTLQSFNGYLRQFQDFYGSFSRLTDASKINIRPERITIHTVRTATTLQQLLASQDIAARRHEELAILNGMQLNTQLPVGTLVKLVRRM